MTPTPGDKSKATEGDEILSEKRLEFLKEQVKVWKVNLDHYDVFHKDQQRRALLLLESLLEKTTLAFQAGRDEREKEIAAAEDRVRRETREECCRAVCNSCSNGIPAVFEAVYAPKPMWVHKKPMLHDCGAARIRRLPATPETQGGECRHTHILDVYPPKCADCGKVQP